MSAVEHPEHASLSPIEPERETAAGWRDPCLEAHRAEDAGPYIEPGGMVHIALRELGARLVRVDEQEAPQASDTDLSIDKMVHPSAGGLSPV